MRDWSSDLCSSALCARSISPGLAVSLMAVLACGVGESERRDSLFAKTRLRVCVRATPRNKAGVVVFVCWRPAEALFHVPVVVRPQGRSEFHLPIAGGGAGRAREGADGLDRKSTRLNSSH